MSVFTVFFCGTASTRYDAHNPNYPNGELVSTLAHNCLGKEFADWVIIDGPGSGNLQEDQLWEKPGGYYSVKGTLFGAGWEENVAHALALTKGKANWKRQQLTEQEYTVLKNAGIAIQDLEAIGSFFWRQYNYGNRIVTPQDLQEQIIRMFRKGQRIPEQVNLVGWSRGGISCHMMANAMAGDPELKHIPVNIFAIDPVPGPANFQKHRTGIGANVREYVAFYARDERSKGFACVIPENTADTRIHIFPMAGRHATLVGNGAIDGDVGRQRCLEPGIIVRHVAETCLTRWGVSLSNKLLLTNKKLEDAYAALSADEGLYVQMRSNVYTIQESIGENKDRYVSHGNKGLAFHDVHGNAFYTTDGLSARIGPDNVIPLLEQQPAHAG
ncbi:hypothetical protein HEQ72_04275 [Haematospirillum sp. 15-248]|uniref:hypothetical protein n=1 Tax=Haematospirillum sp. 15-248 TaxID=2723107 RepID=UPI00143A1642|nr:hypothetical protein [Haematospirillum sp. 15-248]NKD87524.1 hypothetical protein [Haematospirillum sp. 15-248]